MTQIEIPKEEMQKIVQAAVMQALSPDKRDEILQKAIMELLKPSGYGGTSPLMYAFEQGVKTAAQGMVERMIAENDVYSEPLRRAISKAFEDLVKPGSPLVAAIVAKFQSNLIGAFR